MIDPMTFSPSHFERLRTMTKADPNIIERSVFALGLVEALSKTGCRFVFKGGSSLMLLLDSPKRLSTDVDILVDPDYPIDFYIEKAAAIFPFKREEESIRKTNKNIAKRHFAFYFDSVVRPGCEFRILLDVLFAENPYDELVSRGIECELLSCSGQNLVVWLPSANAILGDKLTAFAPHTIGIRYHNDDFSNDKRLEVIKQAYDVSSLMDATNDFAAIRRNYFAVAKEEINFRSLGIGPDECLRDSLDTAMSLFTNGAILPEDFQQLSEGCRRIRQHLFQGPFGGMEIGKMAADIALLSCGLLANQDVLSIHPDHQPLIEKAPYSKANFQRRILTNEFDKVAYGISLLR